MVDFSLAAALHYSAAAAVKNVHPPFLLPSLHPPPSSSVPSQVALLRPAAVGGQRAAPQAARAGQALRQRQHPLQRHRRLQRLLQQARLGRGRHQDRQPAQRRLHAFRHPDGLPEQPLRIQGRKPADFCVYILRRSSGNIVRRFSGEI